MASPARHFILELDNFTNYDFNINWGDGNDENVQITGSNLFPSLTHIYDNSGIYDISITENTKGGFSKLSSNASSSGSDDVKITKILYWGKCGWTSLNRAFHNATNLTDVNTDYNYLSAVTDFSYAWEDCPLSSFKSINTSSGTSFNQAWYGNKFAYFPLIDTSNASGSNLNYAWTWCNLLKSFPLINTSNLTSLVGTWKSCNSLSSFPLINTSNVNNFESTWLDCRSLNSFPLIDTSNGTNFRYTWYGCKSLSASHFPNLDMSKMTDGTNCFAAGVKLTTYSFSTLIESICANNTNQNVIFHAGSSNYNSTYGLSALEYLSNNRGWTIVSGTEDPEPLEMSITIDSNYTATNSY